MKVLNYCNVNEILLLLHPVNKYSFKLHFSKFFSESASIMLRVFPWLEEVPPHLRIEHTKHSARG